VWSQIADAATSGAMSPYRDLVLRRLELQIGLGSRAAGDLAALAAETDAFMAALDIPSADRLAQLDTIAQLAERVVPVEREAAEALAQVARQD
jgi:hypothetical protein